MHILVVEPGKHPYEKEIENTLENLQAIVNGHIQAIFPEAKVALVCDEEGLLKDDNEWNRVLPEMKTVIKGTFFICGLGLEDFTDLPPELMEKYKKRFWNIEKFIMTPLGIQPFIIK